MILSKPLNMDINRNDKMEQFALKFNKVSIDCKEANSSETQMNSSSFSAEDGYDKPAIFRSTPVVASEKLKKNLTSYLPTTKKKEEIKDIAKDKILPFLPAKSLIRFRAVSKEWDQWIKSPLFALHQSYSFRSLSGFFCQYDHWRHTFATLNHSAYGVPSTSLSFLPELVNIKSSSGGLLLCQACDENNLYYICNPATEDWKKLPEPEFYHGSKPAIVLAFEPSLLNMNADYHLISAVCLLDQPVVCFEVYSSETQSWKQSSAICLELGSPTFTGNGFYMKGVTYWVTSTGKVLSFDYKNDSYEIIWLPFGSPVCGMLTQMHEELCYIGISNTSGNEYSIKIYGGMDFSFRQRVDVNIGPVTEDFKGYRVLEFVDDDIVMILVGSFIYSYSLNDRKVELLSSKGEYSLDANRYLPYVNSLVCVT